MRAAIARGPTVKKFVHLKIEIKPIPDMMTLQSISSIEKTTKLVSCIFF
jgi:hypothetical protein